MRCLLILWCLQLAVWAAPVWPPQKGQPYPDLKLLDQTGRSLSLSSFKGKVIVVEPVGMNCPACNAFAGGNEKKFGPFPGMSAQSGLSSFRTLNSRNRGSQDLVFVQLLLYGPTMGVPSLKDAQDWASHFQMDRYSNEIALVGTKPMQNPASYNMIPGFQLVDRDFTLLVDSTGHNPQQDLYRELLPTLGRLLAGPQPAKPEPVPVDPLP